MSDKPILYVVTSNAVKGASGQPTGFWLSELTHPMHETEAAGYRSEIAAIRAGVAPVDADSLNMDDPVNAHYWQQTDLQQRLSLIYCYLIARYRTWSLFSCDKTNTP